MADRLRLKFGDQSDPTFPTMVVELIGPGEPYERDEWGVKAPGRTWKPGLYDVRSASFDLDAHGDGPAQVTVASIAAGKLSIDLEWIDETGPAHMILEPGDCWEWVEVQPI